METSCDNLLIEYPVTTSHVLNAIRDIYRCLNGDEVERKTLNILENVFKFNFIMIAKKNTRNDIIYYEGSSCAGNCPNGLVSDTKRQFLQNNHKDEDILWYVDRIGKICRVDPKDEKDVLIDKLNKETMVKYKFQDIIYFIPLRDRSDKVHAVIHASIPHNLDPGPACSQFLSDLDDLANHAGIAMEYAELHENLKSVADQRELLLSLGSKLDMMSSLQDKFFLILTGITCSKGLGFNRAFLFLQDLDGIYRGVCGIAPKDLTHNELIVKETAGWNLDKYWEAYQNNRAEYEWPTNVLQSMTLEIDTIDPVYQCLKNKEAILCRGSGLMDRSCNNPLYSALFDPNITYALIPIIAAGTCVGCLYLDNNYSQKEIVALQVLSVLGERLGSLIQEARNADMRERISSTFVALMTQIEELVMGDDPTSKALFTTVVGAAKILGMLRSCVLTSKDDHTSWEPIYLSLDWDINDTFWCEAVTNLRITKDQILEYKGNQGSPNEGRRLILIGLPVRFDDSRFILCMEPIASLAIDEMVQKAIRTLATFSSAIYNSSMLVRLSRTAVDHFLGDRSRVFATNLMRMAAHEMRTILFMLQLAVQNLAESQLCISNPQRRLLNNIKARMNAGIEAFMSYDKFLKDFSVNNDTKKTWTNIEPLVCQVFDLFKPRTIATEKSQEVIVKIECHGIQAKIDDLNLAIIIHNLFSNALKAVKHTFNPEIVISAELIEKSQVEIKVIDNGCGIFADEKEKIFLPGYSGFALRDQKERYALANSLKSTGIGLVCVKQIIEIENNGKFSISTHKGLTTASVILPGKRG